MHNALNLLNYSKEMKDNFHLNHKSHDQDILHDFMDQIE